jgi:thiamine biosynthesis lipoprotein
LPVVERVKPLLGTFVSIRVEGEEDPRFLAPAFAEIALIDRLMSFHQPESEVSRLNCGAHLAPVTVHPHTAAVLRLAHEVAEASDGAFDITVSAQWRDIEIDGREVRFRSPLQIDLGGIAKGYAVDQAVAALQRAGARQGCVNAGGDLRLFGPSSEQVALRTDLPGSVDLPVVELSEGSLASSRRRSRFACVAAESCVMADALTKVVLARGKRSASVLNRFSAQAHFYDRRWGWRHLGEAA